MALPAAGALAAPDAPAGATTLSWYRDATAEWGLSFVHENGARGDKHMIETMGSGVCLLDADGDGDLDVYLVSSGETSRDGGPGARNRYLRNDGGRFTDRTDESGAGDEGYGLGCVAGDVDGDGDEDLVVSNWGPDSLLLNDGSGRFRPVAGDPLPGPGDTWDTALSLFDADGDGDLDLFVASYVKYDPVHAPLCHYPNTSVRAYCDPRAYDGAPDRLFLNSGAGVFTDVSAAVGLSREDGKGLGAAAFDIDDDGDRDLFVANDSTPNFLYVNVSEPGSGELRYQENGVLAGVATNDAGEVQGCMGVALGDADGDGSMDLLVTNFAMEANALYSRSKSGWFDDVILRSGMRSATLNALGWGTAFVDVDLDGDLDLLVANGHIHPEIPRFDSAQSYAQADLLFLGDGRGRFELTEAPVLGEPAVSRGLAVGDIDGDGLPDLVITQNAGPARLLLARAEPTERRNWLAVELRQAGPNTGAVGARVELRGTSGTRGTRLVTRGDSYLSCSSPELHFGLGDAASADLTVTWPDGEQESFAGVPAGQRLRLVRERDAENGTSRSRWERHPGPAARTE